MIELNYNGHSIRVNEAASLTGKELVYYDGQLVGQLASDWQKEKERG